MGQCCHGGCDSLAHAHAEDGDLAAVVLDGGIADAGVARGVSRARAHDQLGGILSYELFEGDLIVSEDSDGGALEDEVLVDIPGEGVVVVDEDDVGGGRKGSGGDGVVGRVVNEGVGRHSGRGWRAAAGARRRG